MEKIVFENALAAYVKNDASVFVKAEAALRPELAGMRIFDEVIFGYASAEDPYFTEAKKPEVIGAHFMTPVEWLPGAKTVISVYLPFTAQVREANRQNMNWPADEWFHGRIDGQAFQVNLGRYAAEFLAKEGFSAIVPMADPRLSAANPVVKDKTVQAYYTSNWSERHAAYAAGLGTFGLSKGLITRKGTAGRILSIITGAVFEPVKRPYAGISDYCINCGACVRNCPAAAISQEKGKIHYICSEFLNSVKAKHAPYYGCGKCQVKVPCEDKAPGALGK